MKYFILFLQLVTTTAIAQSDARLLSFRKYAEARPLQADSSRPPASVIMKGSKIDYLAPLYNAYANKQDIIARYSKDGYYDNLSQTLSFTGDYKSVLECLQTQYSLADTALFNYIKEIISGLKGPQLADARKVILEMTGSRKVVMINEAHCKPLHRAFMYSLLEDLFKKGFRYLAMEMLNNTGNRSPAALTANTGYYTCEPVGGELIRKALSIGFKLAPYEDTVYTHNGRQRDSVQAAHLFEIIQKDTAARIVVFAGYGHIEKRAGNDDFVPMAFQFKNISHIDPLCIDQTTLTEEGNEAFSQALYNQLQKAYPAKQPAVMMKDNHPVRYTSDSAYDLLIIHPRSSYYAGRATWYSLNHDRKLVSISKYPEKTFLIQAYYLNEWLNHPASALIPADQTYCRTSSQSYTLFLKKGKYKILYRDMGYKIIGMRSLNTDRGLSEQSL